MAEAECLAGIAAMASQVVASQRGASGICPGATSIKVPAASPATSIGSGKSVDALALRGQIVAQLTLR